MMPCTSFARRIATIIALTSPVAHAADAPTPFDRWGDTKIPAAPTLQPITVDSSKTALLVLDMSAANCVEDKRPSCVRSLPHIRDLLDRARARNMLVVYSSGVTTAAAPEVAAQVAPLPSEPRVRAPVDKFFQSNLETLLTEHKISQVIVTGTSAEGAVLYTASGAALRNFTAIVPIDGYSAIDPFAEIYTAWHLKNAPAAISSKIVLSRSDLILMK